MTSPVRVTIERLGHKGDGIAPGPVFVPRVLPGEVVEGIPEGEKLTAPRIVTPSAARVAAPCRHYKACGGCSLQHVSDDFVAEWKLGIVRTALEANGLSAPLRRLHTSPPESRRRAVFGGRRTKSGAIVGFHGPQSHTLTAVPDCRVLDPALTAALPVLEQVTAIGGSRKGELRLTTTVTDAGLDLSVQYGPDLDLDRRTRLTALVSGGGVTRLTWNDETVFQETEPFVTIGGFRVPLPPGAFLQATIPGEAALTASVADALDGARGAVADLFSGIGTFTFPLAARHEVHAVEGAAAMTSVLDRGWRGATGIRQVTTETRDLFRRPLLPDELKRFAALVIDPPRAGAAAQIAEIATARVPRVAHVSCNPVTFARDAATLVAAGYALDWVDVVDQFRWSPHVELAASFTLTD
ncbi:class I SAM-dependent RNA methyltransferase [Alphaproteobacteria bacterium GH1-50]|uniref:Class I SAM-dependent RNA methyltransferase n=1 Tax=Kangsaoukella pontilimi TaxID=2691042 RepID=A0A7C9MAU0_9RHOB|nr:class I SAM-dependent RNA methyltransferase [Kangsaoukella pontilimi]MXQ08273.1 class I SAM-dependent RNA methyltransferase [Kangsaoukella pontilimi]